MQRQRGGGGGQVRRRPRSRVHSERGEVGHEKQTRKRDEMRGRGRPGGVGARQWSRVGSEKIGAVHGREIEVKRY
jgi:hypothetical protein